jgi:hypothetical protein
MNLQEAINLAQTTSVNKESILHIGKDAKDQYVLLIVTYNDDDKWFVIYYQSGSILPNGSIEQDTFCGDNEKQLSIDLAEFTDVNALQFHKYPIAPGHLIDHEMKHILNALFPQIELNVELIHYQQKIDKHLATL